MEDNNLPVEAPKEELDRRAMLVRTGVYGAVGGGLLLGVMTGAEAQVGSPIPV